MIRISTIFIAICMVLVAASLGLVLYSLAGLTTWESAIVALTALTFLILYNAVSMRLRDRTDVGSQIADLSRGTGDLARQVAEFGRRLSTIEQRLSALDANGLERVQTAMGEIGELGTMVKGLAQSVSAHEDMLATYGNRGERADIVDLRAAAATPSVAHVSVNEPVAANSAAPAPQPLAVQATSPVQHTDDSELRRAVKSAIEANRIDLYLQPMVTLPQRKVRFYEAVARLRDDSDRVIAATDFIPVAESAGVVAKIDHAVILRCMQVLRRLHTRSKDVGVFCNIASATLKNEETFGECRDFLEANRALAPSFILEFKQATLRNLSPIEIEHLAALSRLGYGFSIDHVTDLRLDPRALADRGVKFIKVPATLLLDQKQLSASDIHASDLSDMLGRFGIDLVAERIEGERSVVDLLDYDVRFGQGFLFAPPRPLKADANGSAAPTVKAPEPSEEPAVTTGNAALARRMSAQA